MLIVSANDRLVQKFLSGNIKFNDISKILLKILTLKEFERYKKVIPKNIKDIHKLSKLVSFKIDTLSV